MGLFDFVRKQFIDIIQWAEDGEGVLAWRFPMQDQEIQTGAQLTVRETQLALFVNEGKAADAFGPGLHRLNTRNLPILTDLKHWETGFESPFKSDVYFFSTRQQTGQRWGTLQPITFRDKEFGPLRLRAHGVYAYTLSDPRLFHTKVSGTRERYTREELATQLEALLQTGIASTLAASSVPFVDMASNQQAFSEALRAGLAPAFAAYGLTLDSLLVESLSLPEELQAHFDKAASQRLVGDLGAYARFQTADALGAAAANPGGLAGAGVGIGAGAAMGQMMAQSLGAGAPGAAGASASDEALAALEKLAELLKKGIVTQAEFDAKKAELLKKIG
jgi:membrane protease subunit (stomatin/prohibitin family)